MTDRMKLQSDEFDAANRFSAALRGLPPIVDDDYPEARSRYEGAAYALLRAMKANGRFDQIASVGELRSGMELSLEQIGAISWQRALKWHEEDKPWTPERWVTAILGELGEMANITKKLFRARDGAVGILKGETPETLQHEERKEWADTMHYMILFAMSQEWDMTEVLREVFNAKSEQLGFGERL